MPCAAGPDVALVATADPARWREHAPEAAAERGPWRDVALVDAPAEATARELARPADGVADPLRRRAFRAPDAAARLAAAGRALDDARTPAHLLAMASACMEVNDLDNAGTCWPRKPWPRRRDWAAAHFEHGKYWLRRDDMAARRRGLRPGLGADARRSPSAAANWGATLGELDRPDEALAAFHARAGVATRPIAQAAEQLRRRAAASWAGSPSRRPASAG